MSKHGLRNFDSNAVIVRPDGGLEDNGLRLPNPSVLTRTDGNRVVIQDCWIRDDRVQSLSGEYDIEHFQTVLWNMDMIIINGEWRHFA